MTTETKTAGPPGGEGATGSGATGYAASLVVTVLVILGAIAGPSALADPTGAAAEGVRLEVGWGYVVMAPVANVLDTLSILTLGQHYAVLVTLLLLFVGWRLLRRRRRRGIVRRVGIELGVAALSLLGLAAFYGYGIVGPRPMAALVPEDADVVVVDVHSHTDYSHDGRPGFDAEDNRAWHAAAGFDAVYVSDHRTWDGWRDGTARNPVRAGEGTVLLPAMEAQWEGTYASALGEPWRYRSAVDGNEFIVDSIYRVYRTTGVRPTFVVTIPENLDYIPPSTEDRLGFVAIELSDASPKGLRQSHRDRALLLQLVDSLDLAPVAATNNHGWGRTAAAWTLMRIPGWRGLPPDVLGGAIETKLHTERRSASRVVERRNPWLGETPLALAGTVPAITWAMFGGLGSAERVSWLVWTWALSLLVAGRKRRADDSAHPGANAPS